MWEGEGRSLVVAMWRGERRGGVCVCVCVNGPMGFGREK